jgi:hypothetical protein
MISRSRRLNHGTRIIVSRVYMSMRTIGGRSVLRTGSVKREQSIGGQLIYGRSKFTQPFLKSQRSSVQIGDHFKMPKYTPALDGASPSAVYTRREPGE